MRTIIVENEEKLVAALSEEMEKCARDALKVKGVFRVGLSGGSLVSYLRAAIPKVDAQLEKWKFFFCDERFVPESDPESTFGAYKATFVEESGCAIKAEQFVKIKDEVSLEECAEDYEQRIRQEFQTECGSIPQFDLLLLGMGPDGHTCSLFPGHPLLAERKRLVAPIDDSPKPPPQRITMTLPLINNAKCCLYAISGASKADMVKRVFKDREQLPAAMVRPPNGELVCLLDESAAQSLRE